jgi:hypothetical protein
MKLIIINSIFVLLSISCSEKPAAGKKDVLFEPKPFTAADAEADYEKGNYRLITYGLQVSIGDRYPSTDSLAKVYGFYYDNQGCDVYEASLAGADEYNFTMERLLQKRNGKHWKEDFDWKMDSMAHEYDLKHRDDTE